MSTTDLALDDDDNDDDDDDDTVSTFPCQKLCKCNVSYATTKFRKLAISTDD